MHSTRSGLFLALVGAILVACGGSGSTGGGPPAPEGKLSIAYTALNAKVGDQVALTAHLENVSGEVSWSLDGVGALSAAAGQEIVYQATAEGTAAVKAAAAGLTAAVTIHVVPGGGIGGNGGNGGNGGGGGDDPVTDPPTITVNGLVLNANGYPVHNQAVFILGMPGPATATDGTGHFTIAGVAAPYDLAMVVDATNAVYVYRGLTRPDPTLYVNIQGDQTDWLRRVTVLRGLALGGDAGATQDLQGVGFVSPAVNRTLNLFDQHSALPAIPGPYEFDVRWNGPLVTTGTLVGVQVQRDPGTGAPVNYWYAAEPNVTLMGNQPFLIGPPLTFNPVATANTEGDIFLARDYVLLAKFLGLSFENGVFFRIHTDVLSNWQPSFKFIAPDIANARSQVCAVASNLPVPALPGNSITCLDALAPESRGAVLRILAAPQPFAPANTANDVTASTHFSWSPFTGGVYAVRIVPANPSNPTYFIFTAGTSTLVPDLSVVGLSFGSGDYAWNVTGFAPFDSLDAFTAEIPAAATFLLNQGDVPPVPNASVAFGRTYSFTH